MFKIINTPSLVFKTHFKFSKFTIPSWATCDPYLLSENN